MIEFLVRTLVLIVLSVSMILAFTFPSALLFKTIWNYVFSARTNLLLFGCACLTYWKAYWLTFIVLLFFKFRLINKKS